MSTQIVSGLTTIAANERHHWEYWFGQFWEHGLCVAGPQIFNNWTDTDVQLVAQNQGRITRSGLDPGGFTDIGVIYTVDIANTDSGSTAYYLLAGAI